MPWEGYWTAQAPGDTWLSPRLPGHLEPVGGILYLITSINLSRVLLVLPFFKNISISLLPSAVWCDEAFHCFHHANSHIWLCETWQYLQYLAVCGAQEKDQYWPEVLCTAPPLPSTWPTVLLEYVVSPPSPGARLQGCATSVTCVWTGLSPPLLKPLV